MAVEAKVVAPVDEPRREVEGKLADGRGALEEEIALGEQQRVEQRLARHDVHRGHPEGLEEDLGHSEKVRPRRDRWQREQHAQPVGLRDA